MAENNDSWWGSWYNTAKSKSAEVLEAVRKDLGEISTVVKEEATAASNVISQTLKLDEPDSTANQVKKSFSAFLGQVGTVLNPAPDDDETEAILITSGNGSIALTGLQKHLLELQLKDSTYLNPPEPALKTQYQRWEDVILEDQLTQDRLARHLASSTVLNEKYVTLVPDKVGHHDFWMRYLFRKALLEDGLAQAEAAERKAKLAEAAAVSPVKESVEPTTIQPKVAGSKAIAHSKSNSELSSRPSTISLHDELSQQSIQSSGSTPSFSSLGFTSDVTEEAVRWDLEEFSCDVELSEEQQNKLLQEYEKEMQGRATTKDQPKVETNKKSSTKKSPQPSNASSKSQKLSTISVKPNKDTAKTKNTKNKTNKKSETKISESKSDMSLPIESDHFKKDNRSKDSVDSSNGSSNSDESWEKEFEDLGE